MTPVKHKNAKLLNVNTSPAKHIRRMKTLSEIIYKISGSPALEALLIGMHCVAISAT